MNEPITAADTPVPASTPENTDAKSRRKRILLFSALAAAIAAAGGGYYTYWSRVGSRYVSTDNAQVDGSRIRVSADNYYAPGGYTDSGWIAASSVDGFLHPYVKPTKPTQPGKPAASQSRVSAKISLTWPAVTAGLAVAVTPKAVASWAALAASPAP